MEFLKELFQEKPLTFDEFADKVQQKGIKLFDLSAGGYMSMEKHNGIVEGLKAQLGDANAKLEGYDPEWKKKAEAAEKNFQAQIAKRDQTDWLQKQMDSYGVQSPYARKQLIAECMSEDNGLPWKEGAFLGFDDFMKTAKEKDSSLYQTAEEKAAAEKDAALKKKAPSLTGPLGDQGQGSSKKFTVPKIF